MPMPARRRPFGVSATWMITLAAALAGAGCQQYERAPLDLDGHRSAFARRGLGDDELSDFARRLRAMGAVAPASFSLADGLAPAEGEVVALFYNADLRLARRTAGIALATYENAGLWDDPVFGFDGAEILSSSSPFQFGAVLSLTIPISGRLEVEKARAGAAYEAELRRIVDAEWATRAHVRRAWTAWTMAEAQVHLVRAVLEQVERIADLTGRLEAAGELSRVEARLFRVEVADRQAALAEAELRAQQRRLELMSIMGLAADAPVELVSALPIVDVPDVTDPIDRLIATNTELAVRRAEHRVAEEALRLEIRRQYPDITIGSGYGSEEGDDRLLLGVSMPIPIVNANRAAIAEARTRRDAARAAAEVSFERLAAELAAARASLDAVRVQRDRYEAQIVPMLAEQFAETERIAELGEVDTLLLLEVVTRQFEAKARLLELQRAEGEAAITVARLLGPTDAAAPAPVAAGEEPDDSAPAADDPPAGGGAS